MPSVCALAARASPNPRTPDPKRRPREYPAAVPPPLRLAQASPDEPRARFTRGRRRPRAISWFGYTAFWGHLRHLVASAIATENIDSRNWMIPDEPDALLARVAAILNPGGRRGTAQPETLVDALGGEAWIDFVADTGDDVSVSEAVARLLFAEYELEDGTRLPRGDVLILGGDLAYPVATVREMTRRLVEPWNRVLESLGNDKRRVLLGIPGNHDWYDGLDGFARLCQASCPFENDTERLSEAALHPTTNEFPVIAWAEAFTRGVAVAKPDSMALYGYEPVQRASYFRLALAPDIELYAVDRQLRHVDPRQRAYFRVPTSRGRVIMTPDPARAWGERRPHGVETLAALGIDPARDPSLFIAGDIHHYERSAEGPSVHVVAGGGGAFLHGSRVASRSAYACDVEFPGPRASKKMLGRLPWHMANGGAGWVLSTVFAVGHALALGAYFRESPRTALFAAVAMSACVAVGTALLIGWRRHRALRVVPFALGFGVLTGAIPLGFALLVDQAGVFVTGSTLFARTLTVVAAWLIATWASGLSFGAMLTVIARLGLNHAQPYAALGVPGYKHFVRLRVTQTEEGGAVEAFVVGVVDPLSGEPPVLVDRFAWSPPRRSAFRDKPRA